MKLKIAGKMLILVMILALAQIILIGVLANQSENSLKKEAANRLKIQEQQVDIQVQDYKNLIDAMHVFTGNNIETNIEVARIQFKKDCGDTVESVNNSLICPNNYVIEDTISDNSLVKTIKTIVRGHSSIFIDMGEEAKKISTTITDPNNMYYYGYIAEQSMYDKVFVKGESFIKFTKVAGVPKTKACDPLKNTEGKVVGNLCVGIPEKGTIEQIKNKVKEYKFGDAGIVYIIDTYEDRLGNIIAHPTIEENTNVLGQDHIDEIIESKEGIIQYSLNGENKIASYTYYEPYDMIIVAENALVKEQSIQSKQIIFLSLVVLVISIIAGLIFSKTITKPIIQLKDAADKVTSGEEASLPSLKGQDEVAELTGSMAMLIGAFKFAKEQQKKGGKK